MRQLKRGLKGLQRQAVKNKRDLFEDVQKQQLRQGIRGDGKDIRPLYGLGYYRFKRQLSTYQAYAPYAPDLYLTGAFHRGIRLKLRGDKYTLDSTDSKNAKLTKKYGKGIWGIAPFNMPRIRAACNIELRKLIAQKLN